MILVLGQEQTQSLRGKRSPDLTTLHRKRIFENAERRFGAVKAESTGALPTWCAFRSPGRGLMGESEAKILTNTPRTRKPDAQHQADMEILRQQLLDEIAIPVHGSAPARARRSIAPARTQSRTLTPAEKRMKKIRGLLAKMPECPDPETYCFWMDKAKIPLPEVCRSIPNGPKTYREAYKNPSFAAAIRSEKSRAWSGLNS